MIEDIVKYNTSTEDIKKRCEFNFYTRIPAVYFLLDKDKNIVYIGSSVDVNNRLRYHNYKKKIDFKYNYIIPLINHDVKLREIERYFISKYKPKYNIIGKSDKNQVRIINNTSDNKSSNSQAVTNKVKDTKAINFKIERVKRGMTQTELADAAGCSKQTIGKIERGHTNINYKILTNIEKYFSENPSEL